MVKNLSDSETHLLLYSVPDSQHMESNYLCSSTAMGAMQHAALQA